MRYLKAVAVGLATGIGAGVLWIEGNVWLPAIFEMVRSPVREQTHMPLLDTARHMALVLFVGFLVSALVGFVGGFYWSLARSRRRV